MATIELTGTNSYPADLTAVQSAVDGANAGDTLALSGTFNFGEDADPANRGYLAINKGLILQGEAGTTIKGGGTFVDNSHRGCIFVKADNESGSKYFKCNNIAFEGPSMSAVLICGCEDAEVSDCEISDVKAARFVDTFPLVLTRAIWITAHFNYSARWNMFGSWTSFECIPTGNILIKNNVIDTFGESGEPDTTGNWGFVNDCAIGCFHLDHSDIDINIVADSNIITNSMEAIIFMRDYGQGIGALSVEVARNNFTGRAFTTGVFAPVQGAIRLQGVEGAYVAHNILSNITPVVWGTPCAGIYVMGDVSNSLMKSNTISAVTGLTAGIAISRLGTNPSTRIVLKANTISGAASYGILLADQNSNNLLQATNLSSFIYDTSGADVMFSPNSNDNTIVGGEGDLMNFGTGNTATSGWSSIAGVDPDGPPVGQHIQDATAEPAYPDYNWPSDPS